MNRRRLIKIFGGLLGVAGLGLPCMPKAESSTIRGPGIPGGSGLDSVLVLFKAEKSLYDSDAKYRSMIDERCANERRVLGISQDDMRVNIIFGA